MSTTIVGRFSTPEERKSNERVIYTYPDTTYRVNARLVLQPGHGNTLSWDARIAGRRVRCVTEPRTTEADLKDKRTGPTRRAELEAWMAAHIASLMATADATPQLSDPSSAATVGRACDLYRQHVLPGLDKEQYRDRMALALSRVEKLWGRGFPLAHIDQAATDKLAEAIRDAYPSRPSLPRDIIRHWAYVCSALHEQVRVGAARARALADNPMVGITFPPKPKNTKTPEVTSSEFRAMVSLVPAGAPKWYPTLLQMAWTWGRRRSEVRLLDRDDLLLTPEAIELGCRQIDGWDPKRARRAATLWRYGAIAWRAAKAKGTRKRKSEAPDQVLPLTRKQRQLVDAHLATLSGESHWLFPAPRSHSRPVSPDRLTKLFRATAKAAKVYLDGERYGYHAFRRAVRYRLHVAKVEKDDVAVLMGWSSGAAGLMAERYLRRASQPDVLWNLVHALDFEVTDSAAEQEQCFLPPEERAA